MTLFCRGRDSAKEKWEGPQTDFDTAAKVFGADDVKPIDEFPSVLKSLTGYYSYVYADATNSTKRGRQTKSVLRYLTSPSSSRNEYDGIIDALPNSKRKSLAAELGPMRAVKSEAEQRVMREAADISGRAHAKVCSSPTSSDKTLSAFTASDDAFHPTWDVRICSCSTF